MKVLLIWGADYPWDIRIEKFARTLSQNGHYVHLLCRNLGKRPAEESWEYGHIHRLTFPFSFNLNYAASFPVFLNPVWFMAIAKILYRHQIDCLVVRDLPLALSAILAGKLYQRPVIFDMAENYPALMEDTWQFEPFRIQNLVIRNPHIAKVVEKLATKLADLVIVVIEETSERLVAERTPEKKLKIVRNTPDLSAFENTPIWPEKDIAENLQNRFVITYVGGLEFSRGIEIVIKSLPKVVNLFPETLFWVIGSGNSLPHLQDLTALLDLTQNVRFEGWVDFKHVPACLKLSSVGIIPHHVTSHTNFTIPNKLFDYMYFELPVLASNCRPIARIIRRERCGLVFRDETELSEALIQLRDPANQSQYGKNGNSAVLSKFNWERDGNCLTDAVQSLVKGHPRCP